jgi:hypothetical protein
VGNGRKEERTAGRAMEVCRKITGRDTRWRKHMFKLCPDRRRVMSCPPADATKVTNVKRSTPLAASVDQYQLLDIN